MMQITFNPIGGLNKITVNTKDKYLETVADLY